MSNITNNDIVPDVVNTTHPTIQEDDLNQQIPLPTNQLLINNQANHWVRAQMFIFVLLLLSEYLPLFFRF